MNRNSKNSEILENPKVKELLDKGHVIVVEVADTKNEEYKMLFLVQFVQGNNSSSINSAQAALLGFNKQLERCVANASKENVEKAKLQPGMSLNDAFDMDFSIQVNDTHQPNENFDHSPRATRDGEALVDKSNGKDIYRHQSLVVTDSLEHSFIPAIPQSQYEGTGEKVTAKTVLENAKS